MIYQVCLANEILGVGMYTSLMETFDFPAPINYIGSTSVGNIDFTSKGFSSISNKTDPWILPTQDEPKVPLSATIVSYQVIYDVFVDPIMSLYISKDSNVDYMSAWAANSMYSSVFLDMIFSLDESILESMTRLDKPWEDMHHKSYFLPDMNRIKIKSSMCDFVGKSINS